MNANSMIWVDTFMERAGVRMKANSMIRVYTSMERAGVRMKANSKVWVDTFMESQPVFHLYISMFWVELFLVAVQCHYDNRNCTQWMEECNCSDTRPELQHIATDNTLRAQYACDSTRKDCEPKNVCVRTSRAVCAANTNHP